MFGKLFGKQAAAPAPGRLTARLARYPGWHVPHLGTNGATPRSSAPKLAPGQLRENLHAYAAAMPERLAIVRALLGEFGLDADDAYHADRRTVFLQQLHVWLLAELPPTWTATLAEFHVWEPSDRSGDAIVYSLMGDLAMLFADILLKAKPGSFIGMNLDPGDRRMVSYGRPCLLGLSDGLFPGTHRVYDFEDEMFGTYRRMKEPAVAFAKPETVARGPSGRMIGNTVVEAVDRYVVEPDLPERRRTTWMTDAA